MNCTHCGQPNDPSSRFCQRCGAPIELPAASAEIPPQTAVYGIEVGARSKRGKTNVPAILLGAFCVLLAAALTLTLLGVTDAVFAPQHKSFETPEDAITYFMECVKAGNYEGAMAACAVDEVGQSYDYEAMIKRIQAITPSLQYLPAEYELYGTFNEASIKSQIMRQLAYMAFSVTLPDEYAGFLNGVTITEDSGDIDFDDVVDDMNPEDFMALEIVTIGEADMASNSSNRDNMEKQADIYGADDMVTRDVLYDIGGDYYIGGVTLLEYEGGWRILSLNDALLGQSVYGALIPVDSESDFEALLGEGSTVNPEVSVAPETMQTPPPPEEAVSFTIAYSASNLSSNWYAAQLEDITANLGENTLVTYDANYDSNTQIMQIEEMIVTGVDIIVIIPVNYYDCAAALQNAKEAGIPVILQGIDTNGTLSGLYTASISYDIYSFTSLLAEWLEDNADDTLSIGQLTMPEDFEITTTMKQALTDVAARNPGWSMAGSLPVNFSHDEAVEAAKSLLNDHPDINVLFCHYDDFALGAIQAVEDAGLTGKVLVVGFGSMQESFAAVRTGTLSALSFENPRIGTQLIDLAEAILNGRSYEISNIAPVILADANNVYELESLIY